VGADVIIIVKICKETVISIFIEVIIMTSYKIYGELWSGMGRGCHPPNSEGK
jgi:hypothetical protein